MTQEQFSISEEVINQIKNNPELFHFHLDMFSSLENNPILKWTHETLKNYENLLLTLSVQERKDEFTVNAYYHLLNLATNYEDVNLNWSSALELAQENIKELFSKLNEDKFDLSILN